MILMQLEVILYFGKQLNVNFFLFLHKIPPLKNLKESLYAYVSDKALTNILFNDCFFLKIVNIVANWIYYGS